MNIFRRFTAILRTELMNQLSPFAARVSSLGSLPFPELLQKIEVLELFQENHVTKKDLAIIRQIQDIDKKYLDPLIENSERDELCWEKFLDANQRCGYQNLNFVNLSPMVMHILEHARVDIYDAYWEHMESSRSVFITVPDRGFDRLVPVRGFSMGPGSCSQVKGTAPIHKYRDKVSFSDVRGAKLFGVLAKISKPLSDLQLSGGIVAAIKASFVPKTADISRLIAPQLNGDILLQYPAENCLSDMLKVSFNIDISTQQDVNRELARRGSLYDNLDLFDWSLQRRSWRPCTIDLVSCSDIIGTALCCYLFPPQLFQYMDSCRTKKLTGIGSSTVKLNMLATMGNAYCFPMQTVVLGSIIRSVYFSLGLPLKDAKGPTYAVYGDDMIVDVAAYDLLMKVLVELSMVPNVKKSFSTGYFRESCGFDAYMGYNVRPVSCESLLDDCDIYSLTNRLVDWGAFHSVDISSGVYFLLSCVKQKLIVPEDFGDNQGLKVPEGAIRAVPKNWSQYVTASIKVDPIVHSSFNEEHVMERWVPFEALSGPLGVPPIHRSYHSSLFSGYYLEFSEKHPVKKVVPVWQNLFSGSNCYTLYSFHSLDKGGVKVNVRLAKCEKSLFPFLWGGFRQLDECVFTVPFSSEEGIVTRKLWNRSRWDLPLEMNGYHSSNGNVRSNRIAFFERLFEDTARFAPISV